MSKNKKVTNNINNSGNSFFKKMKEDKVYSAKVQFIGWGVFILLIIIFLNFGSMASVGNNMVGNNIGDNIISDNEDEDEDESILNKISNNYEYEVNITGIRNEIENINYVYYGKSYDNNIEINKKVDDVLNKYYEIDGYYYIKNENNEFGLINNNIIYDLIDEKYIELDDILKLLERASLDHVLNSSDGEKESVYNLLVRDVVISNKSDDVVVIKVKEYDDKLSISIDYTNLFKVLDDTFNKCEINYLYTNINNVEEFDVKEDDNVDE